jgi:nucleotide-binding universal stress UspA family protein
LIERILFPTDGSELSERAVPLLETVAAAQGAEVYLVQVVSPPVWATMDGGVGYGVSDGISPELYQEVLDELESEAKQNLDRLTQQLQAHVPPIRSRSQVFRGSPYGALLDYEADTQPGLVVMATHGRTGLARFARGSVADCMVREGTAPVLMARSFGREVAAFDEALVPLDGSAVAEAALGMVETLAKKPLQRVRLLDVVEDASETDEGTAYLRRIAARLEGAGLAVTPMVQTGVPGEVIADVAETTDVVIMATHGRSGWNRLRHGSVAEKALRDSPGPLLLVRAGESHPEG